MSSSTANHELSPAQIQRGMRLSIFDGVLAQGFYGLTWPGGVFVTGLALLLGANNVVVGLLAALPPLLGWVNLIAARQLETLGRRRNYFIVTSSIHRAVFLVPLVLPFSGAYLNQSGQIAVLIGVIFVSTVLGGCQHTTWMSWMADIIPEDKRGSFFSRRNMICNAIWMMEAYAVGKILAHYNSVLAYVLVFGAATLLALTSVPVVAAQPDPPIAVGESRLSLRRLWLNAWASPTFRNFLLFQLVWGFTTNLAGPFYNVFMIKSLGIDVGTITIWGILWSLVSTLTLPYWGLLGDRAGNKPTMLFALLGSCATAFGWFFVNTDNSHWLILMLFCLGGFFDTGAGLVGFNMLFGVLPARNKPSYVALNDTVVGAMVGIAPLVGGYLAETMPKMGGAVAGYDAIFLVIVTSTILRLIPLVFIARMPSSREQGFGFMVREFVLTNPLRLFPSLYLSSKSAEQKLSAIGTLSDMRSRAALPELVKSIHDPNPRVRQRALQALGEIGDRSMFEPLVSALDSPLQDVQGEAALALGKIGDKRAVAALMAKLQSNDQHLQRCSVIALGDIRACEASQALIELMHTTNNNGLQLACADALGKIGDIKSVEPLLSMTRSTGNAPVKSSLVAAAGLLVDRKGELYRALSEPRVHVSRTAHTVLDIRTVQWARKTMGQVHQGLRDALVASDRGSYNDAILHMKMVNQATVREYLSNQQLRSAMGFEAWVKLLDSNYSLQLEAMARLDRDAGVALAIVDFYARHCPSPAEPDMDIQEFVLALHAFRAAQEGLGTLIYGRNILVEQFQERLKELVRLLDPS